MPDVENPIFILGTGRCGSTIFHHALSHHARVAWLSRTCETKPHSPGANRRAMQALDLPLPSRYLRKLIYPVEAYPFWDRHCPGFSAPCRDLLKKDATPRAKKAVMGTNNSPNVVKDQPARRAPSTTRPCPSVNIEASASK